MKFNFTGHGIAVTEGLKAATLDKLSKLEKYFNEDIEASVTYRVEKGHQKIEVTIPVKNSLIRAEQVSEDMYASIDLVLETLERQIKRYKRKIKDRVQSGDGLGAAFYVDEPEEEEGIQIVRSKKFGIKPMDPEEACIQMELLGHSFYVFCNAQTDEVNVVYKRKNGSYGLIEPTFD